MNYHPACRDCAANRDCLFQNNDDVDFCGDVQDFDSSIDLPDKPNLNDPQDGIAAVTNRKGG
jgi:hypothetical protein